MDHARQYRCSRIQGSNQALTSRSAFGQESSGRTSVCPLIFFPGSPSLLRNLFFLLSDLATRMFWKPSIIGAAMVVMVPAKGEGTTDQLPMPPDGSIASNLVLRPSQGPSDLFVALFNPHAQPIEPDDFLYAGSHELALLGGE